MADMGKAIPIGMELETASEDPLGVQLEAIKGEVGKEVLDMFEKFKDLQQMFASSIQSHIDSKQASEVQSRNIAKAAAVAAAAIATPTGLEAGAGEEETAERGLRG